MDNASNNLAAMRELSKLLEAHEIVFDTVDHQVPCFPHIINICVTHAIKAYTTADFTAVASTWVDALDNIVDKKAYLQALATDPVSLGCDIVRIIRASGQRRKGFRDTIINSNTNQWYTGDKTQVPLVELLRDVKSCWDSIYFMINRLCALRLAVDSFLALPHGPHDELAKRKLTPMQWEVLIDLEIILEIPHAAQQYMSSESMPILGGAIPAFKLLMIQWDALCIKAPHCAPFVKVGLDWAQKYYERMGQTRAYVIAMFIDPTIRLSWIDQQWGTDAAARARADILKLMTEYRSNSTAQTVPQDAAPAATSTGQVHLHSTLATHYYGLEMIKVRALSQLALQAVDQEFSGYALFVPSPKGTHRLAFWEMLKFWLKKDRLNFTNDWITPQKDMAFDEDDNDLLARLFSTTNVSTLDNILSAIARVEDDDVSGTTVVF
ncbi:ribonuclease H-like domain-containing protein [Boletus edulis]|nr:ribonuclease H-like domain-containing protein [Boletus edulis]